VNAFFRTVYFILSLFFSVPIVFDNPVEYIFGIIVSNAFCNMIDWTLYIISYKITGCITTPMDRYENRSATHWKIRSAFLILVILIGLTGIYAALLKPITHVLYISTKNFWNSQMQKLIDALIPVS